jgi:hypothetical protein
MNKYKPYIYVALPALNEADYMQEFILCLKSQTYQNFKLVTCINQPDNWWNQPQKLHICRNNLKTIDFLESVKDIDIEIIDKSSKGEGWKGKKFGVGWARKLAMERIALEAQNDDLIVSLDADTTFSSGYFQSLIENFNIHPKAVAAAIPYYHKLTGEENADKAILHYEIYLRYFNVNMLRIGSPYAFTAIGSAIVLPVKSYKAIGGMTPHKSGEDFYFLQKLRKYGEIILWNREKVFPAARFSDRVDFGTGPAMIKGREGDWSSYPIYPYSYFDEIKSLFDLFPDLYKKQIKTSLDDFFEEKYGEKDIWQPLRENFKTKEQFVKACHHKFDALRTFQYLKWRYTKEKQNSDEINIDKFLNKYYLPEVSEKRFESFDSMSVSEMDELRNLLVKIEEKYQNY